MKKYMLITMITFVLILILQALKIYNFVNYIVGYTFGFLCSKYLDKEE